MSLTYMKDQPDGGKLRFKMRCTQCGRELWGVFAWRGSQAVFGCDEGHQTEYERAPRGWATRTAAAA